MWFEFGVNLMGDNAPDYHGDTIPARMEKLIRNIPEDLNEALKEALRNQPHLGSANAFVVACMRALVEAEKRGEVVVAPLEFVTKQKR
jgi:hypothetical protein